MLFAHIICFGLYSRCAYVSADNYLVVSNTFQPRKEKMPSTGIGLQNLKDRYQLLSELMPSFGVEGDLYLARIPVI